MQTILVTGGGGFLGSNLVAELAARGTHRITVCDRFGEEDKWRNLVQHNLWEIISPDALESWLDDNEGALEMVFHLGSISSTTERDIDLILKHNFTLTLMLWRWCGAHGKRMVYTSSSAVYGDGLQGFDDDPSLEYLGRLKPLSGYGWSKLLFDRHVAQCRKTNEIRLPQWAGLRIFNAYGPNEYHKDTQKSVISQIGLQAVNAGSMRLFRSYNPQYKDGEQMRDVIYVKDVTRVMLWLLDNPGVSGLFNLGSGKARSFNDMSKAIYAALGKPPRIHYVDMPEGLAQKYQYFTEAKMDRLRAAGYELPFFTLEEGITDYMLNYLVKPDPYR